MMNILTDTLPEAVWVEDKAYPIETDFRVWIRYDITLSERALPLEQKIVALLAPYKEELPPSFDVAVMALMDFYAGRLRSGEAGGREEPAGAPIYSFVHDAPYIYAAFMRQYGLDLTKERLHWLQFKALFSALGETEPFVKIMEYRSCDLSKIRDKQQKQFYMRMKNLYRLPDMRTEAEKERDMVSAMEALF